MTDVLTLLAHTVSSACMKKAIKAHHVESALVSGVCNVPVCVSAILSGNFKL